MQCEFMPKFWIISILGANHLEPAKSDKNGQEEQQIGEEWTRGPPGEGKFKNNIWNIGPCRCAAEWDNWWEFPRGWRGADDHQETDTYSFNEPIKSARLTYNAFIKYNSLQKVLRIDRLLLGTVLWIVQNFWVVASGVLSVLFFLGF